MSTPPAAVATRFAPSGGDMWAHTTPNPRTGRPHTRATRTHVLGDFAGEDWQGQTLLSGSRYGWCDMSGANLARVNAHGVSFNASNMTETRLDQAMFRSCDFTGVDLSGASMVDTDFTGSVYDSHTRFPDGYQPDPNQWSQVPHRGRPRPVRDGAMCEGCDSTVSGETERFCGACPASEVALAKPW